MTAKTKKTTETKAAKKPAAKKPAAKAVSKAPAAPAKSAPKAAHTAAAKPPVTHEMIAARAHQLWVAAGRPHGQDAAIWLRAEAELREESARP